MDKNLIFLTWNHHYKSDYLNFGQGTNQTLAESDCDCDYANFNPICIYNFTHRNSDFESMKYSLQATIFVLWKNTIHCEKLIKVENSMSKQLLWTHVLLDVHHWRRTLKLSRKNFSVVKSKKQRVKVANTWVVAGLLPHWEFATKMIAKWK